MPGIIWYSLLKRAIAAQFGNRPYVSIEEKTYYIDAANGSDSNDGLTSGTAFKTWAKVKPLIPYLLLHNYTINIIGNLPEVLLVENIYCAYNIQFSITGNTEVPSDHVVEEIVVGNCMGAGEVANGIRFNNLKTTKRIKVTGSRDVRFYDIEPHAPNDMGIYIVDSNAYVISCDFGTDINSRCICARFNSHVVSQNNTGRGTIAGLRAENNAVIGKDGTQPTGGSADEQMVDGGVIR